MTSKPLAYSEVMKLCRAELVRANKMFLANPNAANWTLQERAALVWQQAEQLGRASREGDRGDVMRLIANGMPNDNIPEAVVFAMTGQTIAQVLA